MTVCIRQQMKTGLYVSEVGLYNVLFQLQNDGFMYIHMRFYLMGKVT